MKNRNRNNNDFEFKIPFNFKNNKIDNSSLKEESYQSKLQKIYEERQKIQNSIKQLDEEEKIYKNKDRIIFQQKAHMNKIKDPFKYMNLLLEEHFKKNLITNDGELDKFIKKDFDKLQNQLMEDFTLFKNRQKVYLEKLQEEFILLNIKKNNMKKLEENDELKSEPLYHGENIKNIFIERPQNKYNLIINSAGDTKNELINNYESKFYKNKLCHNIIECMGNTKKENEANFSPPENQFIEVGNAKINIDFYHKVKKELKDKRENKKEKKEREDKILNDETKTINFQDKLFETKYNNYREELNELKDINEQNIKIIGDIKNKMTKDQIFNDLTQKQLNIFKKSENEIKDILDNKNNKFNYYNINDEKNDYLQKLNEIKEKYEEDFVNINQEIENLKKKYKNKSTNKSKKKNRNKSSNNITKRTFYNDNPNHYQYNYDRASINIKKTLNRYL